MRVLHPIGPALLVAALLVAAPARAEEYSSGQSGFTFGARLGVAMPNGSVAEGGWSVSDEIKYAVPVVLEAGWRFSPRWTLGGYFQYARAAIATDAPQGSGGCKSAGSGCSNAKQLRAGAQVLLTPPPRGQLEPWVGVGTGLEWLSYDLHDPSSSGTLELSGWEWVNLQAGVGWRAASHVKVGPYASISIGQYDHLSLVTTSGSESGKIPGGNRATHTFIQLGVRGQFDL
jgi:hypothetical protein